MLPLGKVEIYIVISTLRRRGSRHDARPGLRGIQPTVDMILLE